MGWRVRPVAPGCIVRPPKTLGTQTETITSPLLEREAELERLAALLDDAVAGRGAAVAVVGPAGIGKTTLVAAAREAAAARGLRVLFARGGELERDFAYGVVRQLFERPLRELPEGERDVVLAGAAAVAAPAVGLPGEPAESALAVAHGLYWVCANLAERGPLVVVVDDAHWADEASLHFLAYLSRRLEDLPVVLLSAARPLTEAPLLGQVIADPAVVQLLPAPLSVEAVAALLGEGAAPQFVAACHAATAGNPFLCATLLAALTAAGIAPVAAEAERVAELASGAVSGEVVRRMGQLPTSAVAVVRAVAVLGADAELRHAAALAGLDAAAAAAAANALADHGLLAGGVRLEFVHPLLRQAVSEQIPAVERALAHRRAAELLREDGVGAERIAVHLLAAPPAADTWVVETLRAAARAAQGDPAAVMRLLRRALEEPPPPELRAAVLHELGVVELHVGESVAAEQHLRAALAGAGEDVGLRAAIGRDLGLALRILRRYEEGIAIVDETIAALREHDPDRALGLSSELYQTAMMTPGAYRAVSGRFVLGERAVRGDTAGERAYVAALATEACIHNMSAERVREWGQIAIAGGLIDEDDPHSGLWANIAFPLLFAEGFALAARLISAAMERARGQGSPIALARAHVASSMLHLRTGAVREAEADARTALEIGGETRLHVLPIGIGVLVEALAERGEHDAADVVLRQTDSAGDLPEQFLVTWALQGRGVLHLAQGRLDEAIADLEAVGRRGRDGWRPWNPAMFPYRSPLARALLRAGDADRARAVAEEELALARKWGAPRALGVALCTHGVTNASVEDLRESVEVLAGAGAPLEHARAVLELGSAIACSGRRVEARDPLRAAMELAHRCGATVLAATAREELVAAGARPRRIMRTGVDALTPSELRVARMAADGMTNREIAQALFVTLRTVEVHLTHCYQKLDIASRDALPAALAG